MTRRAWDRDTARGCGCLVMIASAIVGAFLIWLLIDVLAGMVT